MVDAYSFVLIHKVSAFSSSTMQSTRGIPADTRLHRISKPGPYEINTDDVIIRDGMVHPPPQGSDVGISHFDCSYVTNHSTYLDIHRSFPLYRVTQTCKVAIPKKFPPGIAAIQDKVACRRIRGQTIIFGLHYLIIPTEVMTVEEFSLLINSIYGCCDIV